MRVITFRSALRLFAASAMGSAACAGAFSLLGACASTETSPPLDAEDARVAAPERDAETDADAGPCTEDCEFFPATCAPDTLCLNGPFDPTSPTAGMDWRIRVQVIRGRSPSDVWMAGAAGTVAHFDGTSWTKSEVGTHDLLGRLWLTNRGEITFRTLDAIHSRGLGTGDADASVSPGGWSVRKLPPSAVGTTVTAVWSQPGAEALWLATTKDFWRLRLTGASQLEVDPRVPSSSCGAYDVGSRDLPCHQIRSLHGVPGERLSLWAVGSLGAAIRITDADGSAPVADELNTQTWNGLNGVWASSNTDVWAVGGNGTIRHYTGDGIRWDVVSDIPTNETLNAVWGTSASDIWAVGDAGVVLHYDGTRWSRVKVAGLGTRRPDLSTVWSPGPGRVWIGGYGVVLALGGNP